MTLTTRFEDGRDIDDRIGQRLRKREREREKEREREITDELC
jgi:hypothetical protein